MNTKPILNTTIPQDYRETAMFTGKIGRSRRKKEFLPVHRKSDGKREVSGLLCSSAVTENSTATNLVKDVVGMTVCVGDQQVAGERD